MLNDYSNETKGQKIARLLVQWTVFLSTIGYLIFMAKALIASPEIRTLLLGIAGLAALWMGLIFLFIICAVVKSFFESFTDLFKAP